jgi:hypothetical protein
VLHYAGAKTYEVETIATVDDPSDADGAAPSFPFADTPTACEHSVRPNVRWLTSRNGNRITARSTSIVADSLCVIGGA